jgi:hypothetical protein
MRSLAACVTDSALLSTSLSEVVCWVHERGEEVALQWVHERRMQVWIEEEEKKEEEYFDLGEGGAEIP